MVKKVIISFLILIVVLFASNMFFSVLYPTVTRSTGLEQMRDSNEGIMISQTTDVFKNYFTLIPTFIILIVFSIIWRKELSQGYKKLVNCIQ